MRDILAKIVDGHVMLETLNVAKLYTGKRFYQREDTEVIAQL